jgi:ribonuclease D
MFSDVPNPPPPAVARHEPAAIRSAREAIRKTVERVAPTTPIEGTKVLSDEELEELRRQTAQKMAAKELLAGSSPEALRERLKATVERCTKTGKHALPERARPVSSTGVIDASEDEA